MYHVSYYPIYFYYTSVNSKCVLIKLSFEKQCPFKKNKWQQVKIENREKKVVENKKKKEDMGIY